MLPFTTGITEAPADPDERSRSDVRSTPYFNEFCSARSLRKASSFRPVIPSARGGSGVEYERKKKETVDSMTEFV